MRRFCLTAEERAVCLVIGAGLALAAGIALCLWWADSQVDAVYAGSGFHRASVPGRWLP
jgi:F0F1-type ATP synthase assembly protein I